MSGNSAVGSDKVTFKSRTGDRAPEVFVWFIAAEEIKLAAALGDGLLDCIGNQEYARAKRRPFGVKAAQVKKGSLLVAEAVENCQHNSVALQGVQPEHVFGH